MAEQWTSLRIPVGLHHWLAEECRRLVAAIEAGHTPENDAYQKTRRNPETLAVSLADMIEIMLRARLAHRRRRRAAKANRLGARRPSRKLIEGAGRADR